MGTQVIKNSYSKALFEDFLTSVRKLPKDFNIDLFLKKLDLIYIESNSKEIGRGKFIFTTSKEYYEKGNYLLNSKLDFYSMKDIILNKTKKDVVEFLYIKGLESFSKEFNNMDGGNRTLIEWGKLDEVIKTNKFWAYIKDNYGGILSTKISKINKNTYKILSDVYQINLTFIGKKDEHVYYFYLENSGETMGIAKDCLTKKMDASYSILYEDNVDLGEKLENFEAWLYKNKVDDYEKVKSIELKNLTKLIKTELDIKIEDSLNKDIADSINNFYNLD